MSKFDKLYNENTGRLVDADYFLSDDESAEKLKANIERGIINYSCPICRTKIKISAKKSVPEVVGENGVVLKKGYVVDYYPYHAERSNDLARNCILFDDGQGGKGGYHPETKLHVGLKLEIAYWLEQMDVVDDVRLERFIAGDDNLKRKPDVSCLYKGQRFSFEAQVSYLTPEELINRTDFFRRNKIVNVWVFPSVTVGDLDSHVKMAFYDNLKHVFSFDEKARENSRIKKELILSVYCKHLHRIGGSVVEKWSHAFCSLRDIKFDKNFTPYVFDVKQINLKAAEHAYRVKQERDKNEVIRMKSAALSLKRRGRNYFSDQIIEQLLSNIGKSGKSISIRLKTNDLSGLSSSYDYVVKWMQLNRLQEENAMAAWEVWKNNNVNFIN